MLSLATALLSKQAISLEQLERALAQQMLHGGDLASHLLALDLPETTLTQALAEAEGTEPLPSGELPRASKTALQLVPRDIAERYRLLPLAFRGGVLEIVAAEPLPSAIQKQVNEKLGLALRFRFAPLARIREALAREYAEPLDIPAPVSVPVPELPSASVEPAEAPPAVPEPPPSLQPSVPKAGEERARPALAPKAPSRARRLGPITPALAKEALEAASTRDEVLTAFFEFARQFFEASALFLVQRGTAEGLDAHGGGLDHERALSLRLSLDMPGHLAEARARKLPAVVSLGGEEGDALLREALGRQVNQPVLLLPLVVRDRVVAILYGDHGETAVELAAVGDVLAIAPLVGQSLERLILRRKRAHHR